MAIFGFNPFASTKKNKKGKVIKNNNRSSYKKMKAIKKKAKTCEFC